MKKVIVSDNGVITSNGKAHYIDALPDDFTELQYISTAGKSALDTGIVVQETDTIIVTYEHTGTSGGTKDKFIIANKLPNTGGGIWFEVYNTAFTWYARFGGTGNNGSTSSASTSSERTGVHTYEIRKGYFGIDGKKKITISKYSSMPSATLCVGGRLEGTNITGTTGNYVEVEVVDANGNLRWHGIPTKDSNNVAGLYDLVNDHFHTSDTSYPFTAGPVKTTT